MKNFTVGPVQMCDDVKNLGAIDIPYFRTPDFSKLMCENEKLMLDFSGAPNHSRAVFMTCSSTGSMEAVVINLFGRKDKVLIVNGGSFGARFVKICSIHNIQFEEIKLRFGQKLTKKHLEEYEGRDFSALLVNIDETSSGVLYDANMLGNFCKRNKMLFVCDCVSSFLADYFNMQESYVDVMITGSQKALACPPGVSIIVLSPTAIERIKKAEVASLYFDLKSALLDGERGQTPFTPAVGTLIQINHRLKSIAVNGGPNSEIKKVSEQAADFRNKIKRFPFELISESPANAVTALHPINKDAYEICQILKAEYGIWVCPNGGEFKSIVFRVGHIGNLNLKDNDIIIGAFEDMMKRGLL